MAINFGLAQPSGGYDYLETLRALGQNQALQQNAAYQQQRMSIDAYDFDKVRQQDAARPQILQQAQNGDIAGAQRQAFAIGDFDAAKLVNGLDEQKRGQLATQMGTLGRLATSLIKLPADQRQQAYQAVAPMLVKQGFDPALVQAADLSDGGLQQYIAAAGSTDDVLKNYYKQQEGYTLNQGDRRYVGSEMVAENPAAPKYQSVPEGGMLVRTDGGTATPVFGMGGGDPVSRSGGAASGRYQYGWTPRARNGGDNSDAAVDGKIAGMSQALGIPADQPFPPGITPTQIAQALTLSEGGRGSIADRNNNPGNLRDPRTGDYRKFATKADGLAAAAAQVRRNLARGQNTIQAMVEGVPAGGGRQAQRQGGGAPDVIYGRPKSTENDQYRMLSPQEARQQGLDPNTRWQVSPKGQITALPAKGDKPLTEGQSKAVGFLERAVAAQNSLNEVTGYNPNVLAQNLDKLGTTNPFREGLSQTDRRALSSIRSFVLAVLRQDSGAAIAKDEFEQMAQTLFPLPGDGPEVQADKRRQREAALRGLRTAAGPGSDTVSRVKVNPRDRNAPENRGKIPSSRMSQFKIVRVQ